VFNIKFPIIYKDKTVGNPGHQKSEGFPDPTTPPENNFIKEK
jgi:hypothetical protein